MILKFVKKIEELYQSGHLQSNHYTNTVDKSRIVIDRVPIFPRFSIICDRNLVNKKVKFKNSINLDTFIANVIASYTFIKNHFKSFRKWDFEQDFKRDSKTHFKINKTLQLDNDE